MTNTELRELLDALSLEEKVGQLVQLTGEFFAGEGDVVTGPLEELGIDPAMVRRAGSALNAVGAAHVREIQDRHLAASEHKVPLVFMADVVYGCKTIFPIPLGFSASWDPELVKECFEMAAREARSMGIQVTFAPMLDLIRDARWGRCLESTGEDPWLQSRYATAMVTGLQGSDLRHEGLASCIKHFAGYGAAEAGKEYNTVDMSERRLREMYFPPYRAAVEAGCKALMPSFNVIDEVPSTANTWLLRDVLRGEWGFDGTIVTDYAAIQELLFHGVAADQADAAALALKAGVDVDMRTACYANNLCDLVRSGRIDEELVNEACWRVLKLKNDLGLFEDPYGASSVEREGAVCLTAQNRALCRKMAGESLVLLENRNGVLPLSVDSAPAPRIALIGPYAQSRALLGLWAVHASREVVPTLEEALREEVGEGLTCAVGCPLLEDESMLGVMGAIVPQPAPSAGELAAMRAEALEAVRASDVVVMAIGEHPLESGEAGSKTDLRLPAIQRELLKEIHALGKPVVAVVFSGRAAVLTDVAEHCDALIEAWYPGTEGAHAIADVLFGRVNPSARLTVTFPRATGQVPLFYNAFNTGRPEDTAVPPNRYTSRYVDCPTQPLYPFGYGLSYHQCSYSELSLSTDRICPGEALEVSLTVTNTSAVAGTEVVQLYVRDMVGSVVRPVKELKGFERVHLEPGETAHVTFAIDEPMLRFWRRDMTFGSESGMFEVMVGPNSANVRTAAFELVEA